MKAIVTGGGTGGHIYPALAIAAALQERKPDTKILYVGTPKGMERKLAVESGFDFAAVDVSGLNRSSLRKSSQALAKFPVSFIQARSIIKEFKPDIIVGTGGYASFPVVFSGTFYDCRTFIHEQNAYPGLANRGLANRVDGVLLTFEEAAAYLNGAKRIKVTGLPVRKTILNADRVQAYKKLNLKPELFTILAFGGSRGARSINRAMLEVVRRYNNCTNLQIIWLTGEEDYQDLNRSIMTNKWQKPSLVIKPYCHQMEDVLAAADLAVCRSGASTIAELAVLGLPAILVPFPYAAENHQEKNARALVEKNAVKMIVDEFLDGDVLFRQIECLRNNREELEQMGKNMLKEGRPGAIDAIMEEILY